MKRLIIALFLVLSIANSQILQVEQLFNRKLTKVQKEPLGVLKSFYGTTVLDESRIYDIVSRFDGYVTNLYANETYKSVKKGKALFTIYSDEVLSIQQELQLAKKFNKNLVNSSYEKLQALDVNSQIIQKIRNSKKIYKNIPIFSPSNAIVLEKNINKGSYVKKGNLLLRLASLDKLWFIAKVYQKDLAFIKKDLQALVKIDGMSTPIKSSVDFIYPNVDTRNKSVDVRFILDNKDLKLYPNMFAKVELKTMTKSRLTLPKSAVLTKGEKYYVFKPISKSEFEPMQIEAKRISSNKYEILDGLKQGDEVISNALFLLDSDAITNNLYESDDDDW